jgi:alanyl-tRNA synthetase
MITPAVPTTEDTLNTFIDFLTDRGHRRITGSTLLTEPGDPVLFTSAGMHPLIRQLEGKPHPLGRRLVNVQRCLRTTDLDEVGDDSHLTVFEMLGSWSLGDYDLTQSIRWGYELLTDGFGFRPEQLFVTVFGGDDHVGSDEPSRRTWGELGLPVEPLQQDNWWSNGPVGPCGPDTEIFVWTGAGRPTGTPSTDEHWMELWNHVGMRYHRDRSGRLTPLGQPNVDTGMGLERLMMILQGRRSVFETDLFEPWVRPLTSLWGLDQLSMRTVSDHLRSAVVVLGDGVRPSNTGRGYVLRRLLRRVLTVLWQQDSDRSLGDLPDEPLVHTLTHFHQDQDPGVVHRLLCEEEGRFGRLLQRGRQVLRQPRFRGALTDEDYAYLHDTHGLPRDLLRSPLVSRGVVGGRGD